METDIANRSTVLEDKVNIDRSDRKGELGAGTLKLLPLREGAERHGQFYLVFAEPDCAGPGAGRLAAIIRERVRAPSPS